MSYITCTNHQVLYTLNWLSAAESIISHWRNLVECTWVQHKNHFNQSCKVVTLQHPMNPQTPPLSYTCMHFHQFSSLFGCQHGACSICWWTALFSLIDRCVAHILSTCGYLWESSVPRGAREQTAVRLKQCIPSSPPVNEEDNEGGWVDSPILLSDAAAEIWTVPPHMFMHHRAWICKYRYNKKSVLGCTCIETLIYTHI